MLQLQAGRPPGNRDVAYDDQGNVVSVTKIDPSRLPSHRSAFHLFIYLLTIIRHIFHGTMLE